MRRIIVVILYFFIVNASIAQQYTIDLKNNSASLKKASLKNKGSIYTFSYQGITLKEINTPDGVFNQMFIPNTYRTGKIGEPQLVSTQKLVEIPAESKVRIRVISYTTDDYVVADYFADNKIIPYQPSYSKNESMQGKKMVMKSEIYNQNAFSKSNIASIKILGTLRDKRIAKITINPTSYNPVTNTLRVYNNIEIEVIVEKSSKAKPHDPRKTYSPYFKSSYQKIEPLVLASKAAAHPDLTGFPVKYLIVAPNNYISGLQDFIRWKTQKGFEVVVGNLNTIGSSSSAIKTWVQNQYAAATPESPAPSFLLLVGDIAQIPASQSGVNTFKVTDLYYASVDGDMFPDMYYGRLPAQDTTQLRTMLAKTVFYEKYKFTDDSFLDDVTLIAGADGTWNPRVAQPTIKYGTTNYFNAVHGFNNVNAYLSTYTNCYSTAKVGVSMINYTAHCSQTSWATPNLTAATAKTLANIGKYTVAIANCCQSANFSTNECIGEAWLRNANAGAVAYLGSVPDTYWYEDFYWSVGAHAPVDNEYPAVSASGLGAYDAMFGAEYQSVDAMVFVGNLAVTEAHNEGYVTDTTALYYWEAYHCLGDPSVIPYLTKGKSNTVTHNNSFRFGVSSFQVKAAPGSTVALSNKNGLIGTALTGADSAAIVVTDTLTLNDSVTIVVTKPHFKPYIKTIPIRGVVGILLELDQIQVNDLLGNSNGKFDVAEVGNLNISVRNMGDLTAKNCWVSITSNNPYLKTLTNNIKVPLDSVKSDSIITLSNKFNFQIADSLPDQRSITFTILVSDSVSGSARVSYLCEYGSVVNAPKFNVLSYRYINDLASNGNHIIDYGETATLQLAVMNTGHAAVQCEAYLSNVSTNKTIQITTDSLSLGQISLNDTTFIDFNIGIPLNSSIKSVDTLVLKVEGGQYFAMAEFFIPVSESLFTELKFNVVNSKNIPLENVKINIGGNTHNTNSEGIFMSYATALNSMAVYSIYKDGYCMVTDSILINTKENAITVVLADNVKFYIHNGIEGLKNAHIKLDTLSFFTDEFGYASINHTKLGTYNYTIKANGYYPLQGSIELGNSGSNLNLKLTYIPDLFIALNAADSNVQTIPVYFENDTLFANENGVIERIDIGKGTFKFSINHPEYYQINDSVVITNENVNKLVYLKEMPDLLFSVLHLGLPIENAKITINDTVIYTNTLGECVLNNLSPKEYMYSIEKAGFLAHSDTLLVSEQDYQELVELQLIAVPINESYQSFKIYPNPSTGDFYIDALNELLGAEFTIVDINGKFITKGQIKDIPQKISMQNAPGVYYIYIIAGNKTIRRSIVLSSQF